MAASSSPSADTNMKENLSEKIDTGLSMERSVAEDAKPKGLLDKLPDTVAFEKGFHSYFMNPMLAEMEKQVQKNNEILDKMTEEMAAERKKRMKDRMAKHIPEALRGSGQTIDTIMHEVEDLIVYQEADSEHQHKPAELQKLDAHGQAAVMAYSLSAYVSTLDEAHLKKFTAKISSDCQLWLTRLFRFTDSAVVYHDEERKGLAKICKLALYQKYPKYATEGFEALYSRPPVIYISAAAKPGLGNYLCLELGLPMSCICTVPCNTVFGASSKMDVALLEKLIQDDIAAAKTPLLLVAFAGTPVVGHVDNLTRLQDICKNNSIWLHVEGNNLATLTMFSVPSSVMQAKSGDSLTIDLGKWIGVPALSFATMFKTEGCDPTLIHAARLNTFNFRLKLSCLPLWICLQTLGHDGIVDRVKSSVNLSKAMFEDLDKITTIKQISREKDAKKKDSVQTIGDLISRAISALLVFDVVTPTCVFRYCEDVAGPGTMVAQYATANSTEEAPVDKDAVYYDSLNTWLAETLQTSCPKVPVDAVEVDREGVCIRYAPLETAQVKGTTEEDVKEFIRVLKENLSVLDATCLQRKKFQSIVATQKNLILIDIDTWAGLGVVRYIPDMWVSQTDSLPDQGKIDINNFNSEIVHRLKAMDTAFSTGHTDDGDVCIRFGLITDSTDIEELVSLVASTGKEVEESSKFLESMSEMVQKGIMEANEELQKESTHKLMEEGVLRQVPLVGSLLNWWSPSKETVKGRTFNLSSGKIFTTETIYKYHMQVQEEAENSQKKQDAASESSSESSSSSPAGSQNKQDTPLKSILKASKSDPATPNSKSAGAVKAELINQSVASPDVSPEKEGQEVKAVRMAQEDDGADTGSKSSDTKDEAPPASS
ncbi:putative pyridoxal-dependent decarboxylase domain-containing protein 2 [Gigantopelta aegis]|uniref:putative pyridoxal-dependent decarboxylase domain-containing protein 2 n=1 Tax=Gigantopelta aegis TaxID=1735272 RepID=UPI001B88B87C|nr:putative pyridoxal-dependent decarboxylase domain-containing protein 2 [Gigantopelta aegis]